MTLTSVIFKIASDFLSDIFIEFAKKGIKQLTKPLIEEMVKGQLEKQQKSARSPTIIVNNSAINSIIITEEIVSLLQFDNRFEVENDCYVLKPVTVQTPPHHFSDTELKAKLIALGEAIQRRKLEQARIPSDIRIGADENFGMSSEKHANGGNMMTTTQYPPPKPVSESAVNVELSTPDVQELKLLRPAKLYSPVSPFPEPVDTQDKPPLSPRNYLKQRVNCVQSRITTRKIERGEE